MKKAKTYRLDPDVIALLDALKNDDGLPFTKEVDVVSFAIRSLAVQYVDVEKVIAGQFYQSLLQEQEIHEKKTMTTEEKHESYRRTFEKHLKPGSKFEINGRDAIFKKLYDNAVCYGIEGFDPAYTTVTGFDEIESYKV